MNHPSYFALDVAALGQTPPPVQAHVASCSPCTAHLSRLARRSGVPGWVEDVARRAPGLRGWTPALLGAVLAGALAILPSARFPSADASKGAAVLSVYVKRGNDVRLWDGAFALWPGDAIRFAARGGAFKHVTVLRLSEAAPEVLVSAPLRGASSTVLEGAWALDEQRGAEDVAAVFSASPLSQRELHGALSGKLAGVWVERFSLQKEEPR